MSGLDKLKQLAAQGNRHLRRTEDDVASYDELKQDNARLLEENEQLRAQIEGGANKAADDGTTDDGEPQEFVDAAGRPTI